MKTNKRLQVFYKERQVGTLALTGEKKAAFEYEDSWLENGFSISPFSLPLKKQVFVPGKNHFQGLFGVFADSLPDAWGNVLLDRMLRKNGIAPEKINILDRLAIVGSSGMGALTYQPELSLQAERKNLDLDSLALECKKVLHAQETEELDQLYRLGGTSGGARPKILTQIEGEEWIIKFPAHVDGGDAGRMEYDYSSCVRSCGIPMTETRLFPSALCGGYFGTKRFDRRWGGEKVHMLTAAALLELDFRQPSLDYHSLMKLTKILTWDRREDVESMFRRMCFNVFAHNRDDHSKNFAFLFDDEKMTWKLSPAYDMTYSNTYYGEHTTSVDGNGRNPGEKELLAVGMAAGISKKNCLSMLEEIRACTSRMLAQYL